MNSFHNPDLVSIGLPTYNRVGLLRRAIDALLAQTYKNFELIISDNYSSDDTQKLCERYAAGDKRIRYIRQKENIGMIANSRFVLQEARGEYFMWACDDDWWGPRFIEVLKNGLDQRPDYGIAMSSFERVYADGGKADQLIFSGPDDLTYLTQEENFFKIVLPGRPFHQILLGLVRTDLLRKIIIENPYPQCQRHDRIVVGEFALFTRIYTVPEILWRKTIHKVSSIVRNKDTHGKRRSFTSKNYFIGLAGRLFCRRSSRSIAK